MHGKDIQGVDLDLGLDSCMAIDLMEVRISAWERYPRLGSGPGSGFLYGCGQ